MPARSPIPHEASGFFVWRTPLLPHDTLEALSADLGAPKAYESKTGFERAVQEDRRAIVERLRALASDPTVREALYVASPSLDEALDAWLANPNDARAHGVVDIVVRYVARMAGRPTPFGLFSGCSMGQIGGATRLELGPRSAYGRHTRLDNHYLAALTEALHADPGVRSALTYRPSTGLYEAGGQLRYAEARTDPTTRARSYHLVSVERTPYLDATLERAECGARLSELAGALVEGDAEIPREDADAFVDGLVDAQMLVSELAPPITGDPPLAGIVATLRREEVPTRAGDVLAGAADALAAIDAAGLGNAPARYRELAAMLGALPAKPDPARLLQVDLYKPTPRATLGDAVLGEIERAVALLARVAPRSESKALRRFREAFLERYGERAHGPVAERRLVPLTVALDDEVGVGFGESADPSPLLDGLPFPSTDEARAVPFGRREQRLLHGLGATLRAGRSEWALDDRDIAALEAKAPARLPDAFALMTTIAASSEDALARGEFRLVAPMLSGPSGAVLLGRFCHGDAALQRAVEAHLRAEEAFRPEAVFAEIVHLPEGRLGNILCRPQLRGHEIAFLGRSGAPRDRQIPLVDLGVTVADGRVVLWSHRLGREVVPRLTSAHNFARGSLGVYRFLCALQAEHVESMLAWSWGPLESAPLLPRVTAGRIVLSPARWNLVRDELASLAKDDAAESFRAVQALRERRELPRWVSLVDDDNVLPVDLDNVVAVGSWVRLVKNRDAATLQETLPADDLIARGPEGRFVHELVVPFVRARASAAPSAKPSAAAAGPRRAPITTTFAPGSEWLFAKLYTGFAAADVVLAEIIGPLVRSAREAGLARWFFVRYSDPDGHVRVRLRGDPRWLASEILPALHERAAPFLADGRVGRIELATYEREVERYGGSDGIELVEALFEADSDAALAIVEQLEGDEGADARWRLALRGCHLLLTDLGLDLAARTEVMRYVRVGLGAEHRVDAALEAQLGKRFRAERAAVEELVRCGVGAGHPLDAGFEALAARSERQRDVVRELREVERSGRLAGGMSDLASSLVHMHVNRLLRAHHRMNELVLCDWLLRVYESEAARARPGRR